MNEKQVKINIEKFSVSFDAIKALKGINLQIFKNEILSIIGPANSGKSSLLLSLNRMIERVEHAEISGKILMDGNDIFELEDVEELRRRVGIVFAMPIPLPMTIRENILFGPRLKCRIKNSHENELLESCLRAAFLWDEVKDRLNMPATRLSGGQQQRLCIARTLALKPEVVLFDEPCSGLDPISTAKVEEAMKKLKSSYTIVLVTNNTKQAARVGDRTAFLMMGELIEVGPTDIIFTAPTNSVTEQYVTGKFG